MAYILYSSIVLILALTTALLLTRHAWLPLLPSSIPWTSHLYTRVPSTFASDAEAGLSSTSFSLAGNIVDGDDSRAGLDDASKKEIQKIMKKKKVTFDEARRLYIQERFRKNDIGPDGRPRDPKFVSFS